MSRIILPSRRPHEAFSYEFWNMKYIAGKGREHESAPVSEVFLNVGKSGEHMQTLARDAAVLLSLALQWGAPLSDIGGALTRNLNGDPSSPIGRLVEILIEQENE